MVKQTEKNADEMHRYITAAMLGETYIAYNISNFLCVQAWGDFQRRHA